MVYDTSDSDSSDGEDVSRSVELTKSPSQEDLVPLLECPVCFDLPLPPIRTCYQGHIICAECCPRLTACPLCLKPIGYGRNFFAEDFINKSIVLCKYSEDGCRAPLTGAQIRNHIPVCDYRPLKCQHCPSTKRISYGNFETHLLSEHRISQWDITEEGVRVIEIEKQRAEKKVVAVQVRRSSSNWLLKFLLALTAVSFLVDQFLGIKRSDFWV